MKVPPSSMRKLKSESDINAIDSNFLSGFPEVLSLKMASTEQLTREPVNFYPLMSGGHAKIYSGTINGNGYVIKKGITEVDKKDILKEKSILSALAKYKHVVNLVTRDDFGSNLDIEIKDRNNTEKILFLDENMLFLEKIEGFQLDKVFTMLEEALGYGIINTKDYFNSFLFLIKDSLEGLAEIQTEKFVHGDLKPNNILYDKKEKHTTYIDFGTAVKQGENIKVGHEAFASPEVIGSMLGRDVKANFNSDLWAIGQIIYKCINSLLHNDNTGFLSGELSKNNSYSDRIANISNLILASNAYVKGESNEASSAINVKDIPKSPIEHTINDHKEFEFFNKNLSIIFGCLEGIFNANIEERFTVEGTIDFIFNNININEFEARKTINEISCFSDLEIRGESLRHSREKYSPSSE